MRSKYRLLEMVTELRKRGAQNENVTLIFSQLAIKKCHIFPKKKKEKKSFISSSRKCNYDFLEILRMNLSNCQFKISIK